MGTGLVVTHPCPRCNGVDKLTCLRCDGSGRVGNRTRAEQVEAYLREDAAESLRGRLRGRLRR